MKQSLKTFILSLFIIYSVQANSQYSTSYLSYEYTEILSYSIKITYSTSGSYKPPTIYDFYGNALDVMQKRYDANRKAVSIAYGNVLNLELINKSNKAKLSKFKTEIKYEIDNNISSWDFGRRNNAEYAIEYISFPFRDESIKNEIRLLQSCQTELNRIKYKDPDNYIYSKRYKSICKTLEMLESCSLSNIRFLSWEKTELNNGNNYLKEIKTVPNNNRNNASVKAKPNYNYPVTITISTPLTRMKKELYKWGIYTGFSIYSNYMPFNIFIEKRNFSKNRCIRANLSINRDVNFGIGLDYLKTITREKKYFDYFWGGYVYYYQNNSYLSRQNLLQIGPRVGMDYYLTDFCYITADFGYGAIYNITKQSIKTGGNLNMLIGIRF